jgi:hypothetical protein
MATFQVVPFSMTHETNTIGDYVAVTAYDRAGTESSLSEEITIMVPPRVQRMPTLMQEVLR